MTLQLTRKVLQKHNNQKIVANQTAFFNREIQKNPALGLKDVIEEGATALKSFVEESQLPTLLKVTAGAYFSVSMELCIFCCNSRPAAFTIVEIIEEVIVEISERFGKGLGSGNDKR